MQLINLSISLSYTLFMLIIYIQHKDLLHITNVGKPWIASMVPPTKLSTFTINENIPKEKIMKHHIFGVECGVTRASVKFNSSGDFIFPTSKYVCVFNKKKNSQIFYEGHGLHPSPSSGVSSMNTAPDSVAVSLLTGDVESDAEVCCVATSRDGSLVASATRSKRPNIHIWDAISCVVLTVLPLLHRRGVIALEFSNNDHKQLVSVGMDQEHSLAVWESPTGNWTDGRLLACSKGNDNFFLAYKSGDELVGLSTLFLNEFPFFVFIINYIVFDYYLMLHLLYQYYNR